MSPTTKHFAEASCKFAVDFIKQQIKGRPGQNVVVFPLGAQLSLALLLLAAKEKTADEILEVLHLFGWTVTSTDDSVSGSACDKHGGFHSWLNHLLSILSQQHSKYHKMKTHCKIFGLKKFDFKKQYIQCLKELYNAELEGVDSMNEEARQKINSWVERHTDGDFLNFIPVNSLDPSTIMVLLNAAFFKGSWQIPFNPKDTYKASFWTCQDQSIYVDMMTRRGRFNVAFISNPPMKVLEIPYHNEEMSMLFLIPEHSFTTDEILLHITHERLKQWTSLENMRNVETKVSIPKVMLKTTAPLKHPFEEMGVKDLFTPGKANLSGMTGNDQFVVSQISQIVVFSISEEGTKGGAAARTEVVSGSHPDIILDNPFIFVVILKVTRCILFLGRVCVPV